ncbi:MAG TPA: AraC family transcriptional regulator, partial [Chitinophaga sp.]|nr:AraC family transcriptional regulator [Chitinophaga sp.]
YRCDFADPVMVSSPPADIIYHTATVQGCSVSNNIFIVREPVQLLPRVREPLSTISCMLKGSVNIIYHDMSVIPFLQGQYNCFQVDRLQRPTLFSPGVYEVQHYEYSPDVLSSLSSDSPLVNRWLAKANNGIPGVLTPTPGVIWDELYHLNREIKKRAASSGLRKKWLSHKLQELLILVLEQQDTHTIDPGADHVFYTIKAYIRNNLDKELTISQLASDYYISESKLRHNFNKYCGMSFSEYQLKLRMEMAKNLCVTEDVSIAHIAFVVGYKNPSALTRVYKSYFGETPSDTRRNSGSGRL